MKKLHLFGARYYKDRPKEHYHAIATIFVRNGRILIENALTPAIADQLKAVIEPVAYSRGFFWAAGPHDPAFLQKPEDPLFLEALLLVKSFWWGKTYDGWSVLPTRSEIIDD